MAREAGRGKRDIERGRGRGAQLSAFLPITSPSDTDIVPPLLASTLKTEESGVGRKTQRGKRDYKRFTNKRREYRITLSLDVLAALSWKEEKL